MKEEYSISTLGGTSLMVIFSVLCLTIFALMSLSTAKVGDQLSDSMQNAVKAYYAADNEAEKTLAALRQGEYLPEVEEADGICSYRCPINERANLHVAVEMEGDSYTVLQWQAVVDDSMIMETQELWDGFPLPDM